MLSEETAAQLSCLIAVLWVAYVALYYRRRTFWKETGHKLEFAKPASVKISVVIPAYNEEGNIADCAAAVLDSNLLLKKDQLEVLVCDDMSKDGTVKEIEGLKSRHKHGDQLKIISAGPRPKDAIWLGKCWAVWVAAQQATGDWIIFVDADVRIKDGGLERAVSVAIKEDCDLLSGDVAFHCSCLAETLVQPLIIQNLVLNNDHRTANDDKSEMASAAGHMMVFKKSSYDAFGGHGNDNIRDHVVEDVMLATLVKNHCGGTVRYYDFTSVARIQMYDSWRELIEGYSKNIYLAFGESAVLVVVVCLLNITCFVLPVVCVSSALFGMLATGATFWHAVTLAAIAVIISLQYGVRAQLAKDKRVTSQMWWAQPLGAFVLVSVAMLSLFKGVTGIGWTWKGRPLRMPERPAQEEESKKEK